MGQKWCPWQWKKTKGPIKAEIKIANIASKRIAENCGMKLIKTHNNILYYYRGENTLTLCPLCDSKTNFSFSLKSYVYHRCEKCHTLFVINPPVLEEIYNGYSESYFEASSSSADAEKERRGYSSYMQAQDSLSHSFKRKLDIVLQHARGGKLLEVGAAYGTFMVLAKEHFNCVGLEVSHYATQVAQDKFGVDVRQGSIENASGFANNEFDVVVMWDVIEHLANPIMSLQEVFRVLKPGGSVFISTDDSNNWLPRILGQKWWGLAAPLHLCHFSKKGMECAINRSGNFSIIINYQDWRKYNIGEIISHFGVSYKNRFLITLGQQLINTWFGKIEITVARPEQFITYAKKCEHE